MIQIFNSIKQLCFKGKPGGITKPLYGNVFGSRPTSCQDGVHFAPHRRQLGALFLSHST